MNESLSFMDLFQEGSLGLMRAIKLYSALQGVNFIAYSTAWIRQSILRFIQDERRLIRFPVHMSEEVEKAEQAQYLGECEIDREIHRLELQKWIPELADSKAINYLYSFISLEGNLNIAVLSDDMDYQNMSVDQYEKLTYDMNQEIDDNYYIGYIRQYLELMPPRSAFIIVRRLGLSTQIQTLEEIASQLNLTRERVRQIEKESFKLLQQMAKSVFIARDDPKNNDQNKKIYFKEGLLDFSARIGRSTTPVEALSSYNSDGVLIKLSAAPKLIVNNGSGKQKMQYIFV
jgi:RNA polymerase sigma factor (sigma-70 family)